MYGKKIRMPTKKKRFLMICSLATSAYTVVRFGGRCMMGVAWSVFSRDRETKKNALVRHVVACSVKKRFFFTVPREGASSNSQRLRLDSFVDFRVF